MQITREHELTPEMTEFLKSFWHDADLEHYGKDSNWQSESIILLAKRAEWNAVKLYEKMNYQKTHDLPNHYLKKDWVEYTKFL